MAVQFSDRVNAIKNSVVGDILKLTEQPDMISFAGGLPAEQTFPKAQVAEATVKMLQESGEKALQYGPSNGFTPLRNKIAERSNAVYQTHLTEDNILVTSGSQEALDLVCRVFCNKGHKVAVEKPTYVGALMAFDLTEVGYSEITSDEFGMDPEALDKCLTEDPSIRMIYVIPDFQNPTGITWSLERRQKFMEVVNKHEIPVIEDNPYGELRFRGDFLPSLNSMDPKGLVLSLGTFSKTFAPGMRLGWVAGDKDLIAKCNAIRTGMDLSTSPFTMRVADAWLENFDYDAHIDEIKKLYRIRCDAMMVALEKYLPKEVHFTRPEGGLFCWVTLPKNLDSLDILKECIENKVAFVPGSAFFTTQGNDNYFRMNYSYCDEATIDEGVKRIGEVLKKHI